MSSYIPEEPLSSDDRRSIGTMEPVVAAGSAGFQAKYLARDLQAGIICGAMAIPLSIRDCHDVRISHQGSAGDGSFRLFYRMD